MSQIRTSSGNAPDEETLRHRREVTARAEEMLKSLGVRGMSLLGHGNIGAVFRVPAAMLGRVLLSREARVDMVRYDALVAAVRRGREVAVKVQQTSTTLPRLRSEAEHEAAALHALSGDRRTASIVPEFFASARVAHGGREYYVIAMELVEGKPLWQMAKGGTLDASHARELNAITHQLHAFGLAHTDLHGGNIVVTPSGKLKFIDFGMVHPAHSGARERNMHFVRSVARAVKA